MENAPLIVVIIVATLMTVAYIVFCMESILNSLPFRIGYVSSDLRTCFPVLKKVVEKYIPDTTQVTFMEPGSGVGHLTRLMARAFTWKEVTSCDISFTYSAIARLLNLRYRLPIRFLRNNLFALEYPPGSFIYTYLSVAILDRLHQEGKLAGCLVVSLTFPLTSVSPTEEIPLPNWQQRILVYDFRTYQPQI